MEKDKPPPEGPELKLMAKYINEAAKNKTFVKIEKSAESKNAFNTINEECSIEAESRGKELKIIIKTEDNVKNLFMTMGMSGNWFFSKKEDMRKHSHLRFYTNSGEVLCFVDPRRFGKWKYADNWNQDRGPDIIHDFKGFYNNLRDNITNKAFEKPISALMMDQKYFNGFGNYIRAEILYRFDIDPFMRARAVVLNEHFLDICVQVHEESFKLGGGEFKTFINPNRNADEKGEAFVEWLQCYEKKKKIVDETGRSFWYDEKWDRRCFYCNAYMEEEDCYNEDGEHAHYGCVMEDQIEEERRREDLDLMGF